MSSCSVHKHCTRFQPFLLKEKKRGLKSLKMGEIFKNPVSHFLKAQNFFDCWGVWEIHTLQTRWLENIKTRHLKKKHHKITHHKSHFSNFLCLHNIWTCNMLTSASARRAAWCPTTWPTTSQTFTKHHRNYRNVWAPRHSLEYLFRLYMLSYFPFLVTMRTYKDILKISRCDFQELQWDPGKLPANWFHKARWAGQQEPL